MVRMINPDDHDYLVGARYSNMLWPCCDNILSKEQGMGSVQNKSWLRALSASSLETSTAGDVACWSPFAGVEGEQLVDEVTGELVLDIGLQSLLDSPLGTSGYLQLGEQVQT